MPSCKANTKQLLGTITIFYTFMRAVVVKIKMHFLVLARVMELKQLSWSGQATEIDPQTWLIISFTTHWTCYNLQQYLNDD